MSAGVLDFLCGASVATPGPAPYDASISLQEHQNVHVPAPIPELATLSDDVRATFGVAQRRGLVSVSVTNEASGLAGVRIVTESTVGFTSLTDISGRRVFLEVRPKVKTQRLLELAVLADVLPPWHPERDLFVGGSHSPLLEWTLRAFVSSLHEMFSGGGLRKTHLRVTRDLPSRLRGRVIVPRLARNLMRGRPDLVPCEFPSLEIDNDQNRLLRWAITVGYSAASALPGTGSLRNQLRAAESHFAGVSLVRPRRASREHGALPQSLRHYRRPLRLAQLITDGTLLDGRPGEINAMSVALDMNDLYERAFHRGLRDFESSVVSKPIWKLQVSKATATGYTPVKKTRMLPDVYVKPAEDRLPVVIDTKWKDTLSVTGDAEALVDTSETKMVKVRSSDIYQAVAYSVECIRRLGPSAPQRCVAALVYPTLAKVSPLKLDFDVAEANIVVWLLGWDLSEPVTQGIEGIWTHLAEAAKN